MTQIPAVIISIASALLLARGGTHGATDLAIFSQFGKHPAALAAVSALMVVFALVPGLPFIPFILGALVLGVLAWMLHRQPTQDPTVENETAPPLQAPLGDILDLDDVHVEFAPDLVAMALDAGTRLDVRITNMRRHIAQTYGLILPEIRLTDDPSLPIGTYVIRVHGVEQQRGVLHPDLLLALVGEDPHDLPAGNDVTEPVYGAPARWIPQADREAAALCGATIVAPAEILATHLLETIKQNFARLLTLKALRRLLAEMVNLSDPVRSEANRKLIDELIPDKVPIDTLHAVLRLLVDEQISIRNMPLILEAVAEARLSSTQPENICEHVRHRIGFQIISGLKREDGSVPLVQLDPKWEEVFSTHQTESQNGGLDVALPPDMFNRLADNVTSRMNDLDATGVSAALVTSTRRRRFLRTVLHARGIRAPVISFEEIGLDARPALVGMVAA